MKLPGRTTGLIQGLRGSGAAGPDKQPDKAPAPRDVLAKARLASAGNRLEQLEASLLVPPRFPNRARLSIGASGASPG
jgi:hypothetical protein